MDSDTQTGDMVRCCAELLLLPPLLWLLLLILLFTLLGRRRGIRTSCTGASWFHIGAAVLGIGGLSSGGVLELVLV